MKIDHVRRFGSLGAGILGQQIALQCAMHGHHATAHDLSSDVLWGATAKVRACGGASVENERLGPSAVVGTNARAASKSSVVI